MGGRGEQRVLNLLPGFSGKGIRGEFRGKTEFFSVHTGWVAGGSGE